MATSHWTHSAVTKGGQELLNEMMAGYTLDIFKAVTGDQGIDSPDENLAEQENVSGTTHDAKIISDVTTPEGRTLCIQVTNADTEYDLHQIGLFAKLGKEDDPEEGTLLFIMQDDYPVPVPGKEAQTFILEVYCVLTITNDGRLTVTVDGTGVVSITLLKQTMQEHNTDPDAHLMPDDNEDGTLFRLGVEDGELYMQSVTITED